MPGLEERGHWGRFAHSNGSMAMSPRLTSLSSSAGQLLLLADQSANNSIMVLEGCTNLPSGSWIPLATNVATNVTVPFSLPITGHHLFLRARQ
jgi:hypothetical protein